MEPLPSPPALPLSSTRPLSEITPLIGRESRPEAARRAADSARIQATSKDGKCQRPVDRLLGERPGTALGLAFGLGILVGYCAADKE